MPNFGTSSNVPIGGSRVAKGAHALFRAKLLLFFAIIFFFGKVRLYRENRQNSLSNRLGRST